jgi:hypothetical protein
LLGEHTLIIFPGDREQGPAAEISRRSSSGLSSSLENGGAGICKPHQVASAPLFLPVALGPPEPFRRRDPERVADQEERIQRRRLQIALELADIRARDPGPEREPLLGESACRGPYYLQSQSTS